VAATPAGEEEKEDMTNHHKNDDNLTKEELALRIREVKEYYRRQPPTTTIKDSISSLITADEQQPQQQDPVCLSLLRTRFSDLTLNRCHVGPSTIPNAGQGLFARRDILPGELITLYPGDALLIWKETVGQFYISSTTTSASDEGSVSVMFGNHIPLANREVYSRQVITNAARDFEVKIGPVTSIVADPNLIHDPAYLAHMINDSECLREEDTLEARNDYSQRSAQQHNAAIVPLEDCHYGAVATKRIPTNTEIFISYGEGYWRSRLQQQPQPHSTKTGTNKSQDNKARAPQAVGSNNGSTRRGANNAASNKSEKKKKPIPATKGFGKQ
jgi:hypothetical protein